MQARHEPAAVAHEASEAERQQQLDIEVSCLEEAVSLSDIIYLLSGQVFADLQPRD